MNRPAAFEDRPPCAKGECQMVRVLDDIEVEITCTRARLLDRFGAGYACPSCGETRLVAIGLGPTCHVCRVRAVEIHHPRGGHAGPATWAGSSAINIIAKEGERISAEVGLFEADLCKGCAHGASLFLGIRLASIGTEQERAA